ncbi:MAG: hypothetical protein ACMXYK_02290 [Candidatus Woesearchaeota archaeon]
MMGIVLEYILAGLSIYAVVELVLFGIAVSKKEWGSDSGTSKQNEDGSYAPGPESKVTITHLVQGDNLVGTSERPIYYTDQPFEVSIHGKKLYGGHKYTFLLGPDGTTDVLSISNIRETPGRKELLVTLKFDRVLKENTSARLVVRHATTNKFLGQAVAYIGQKPKDKEPKFQILEPGNITPANIPLENSEIQEIKREEIANAQVRAGNTQGTERQKYFKEAELEIERRTQEGRNITAITGSKLKGEDIKGVEIQKIEIIPEGLSNQRVYVSGGAVWNSDEQVFIIDMIQIVPYSPNGSYRVKVIDAKNKAHNVQQGFSFAMDGSGPGTGQRGRDEETYAEPPDLISQFGHLNGFKQQLLQFLNFNPITQENYDVVKNYFNNQTREVCNLLENSFDRATRHATEQDLENIGIVCNWCFICIREPLMERIEAYLRAENRNQESATLYYDRNIHMNRSLASNPRNAARKLASRIHAVQEYFRLVDGESPTPDPTPGPAADTSRTGQIPNSGDRTTTPTDETGSSNTDETEDENNRNENTTSTQQPKITGVEEWTYHIDTLKIQGTNLNAVPGIRYGILVTFLQGSVKNKAKIFGESDELTETSSTLYLKEDFWSLSGSHIEKIAVVGFTITAEGKPHIHTGRRRFELQIPEEMKSNATATFLENMHTLRYSSVVAPGNKIKIYHLEYSFESIETKYNELFEETRDSTNTFTSLTFDAERDLLLGFENQDALDNFNQDTFTLSLETNVYGTIYIINTTVQKIPGQGTPSTDTPENNNNNSQEEEDLLDGFTQNDLGDIL